MAMKRFLSIALICAAALFSAVQANAQKFGVIGGLTFSSIENIDNSSKTGWNLGATAQFKLPLGFSLQPSLIYNSKAAQLGGTLATGSLNVGYLELPVSVQWGPDLLIFRPFIDVSPFVGCALTSDMSVETLLTKEEWKTSNLQRFEYGLGLGGGVEIWRFQILCRYNWNFGPLFNDEGKLSNIPQVEEALKDKNFGGVTLSLALLFGK